MLPTLLLHEAFLKNKINEKNYYCGPLDDITDAKSKLAANSKDGNQKENCK